MPAREFRGLIELGCNCGGRASASKLSWTVDLTGTGKYFADGTVRRNYALASEANSAIAQLNLTGTVRPRPTT